MVIYVLQSIHTAKNEIVILISVQYKRVGSSSFGMADDGDSGAGGGGGPFLFSKKESSEVNENEHGRETKYNRYPSNYFVVKCSVHSHHVYKRIWSPCIGEPFEDEKHDKYAVAVHLNNCLTVVGHIPREITYTCYFFIRKQKTTALHSSLWRCRTTMPADVLPPRHQGVGES